MSQRKKRLQELRKRRAVLDKRRSRGLKSTDQAPCYVRFRHPKNLFEIDYPAHWKTKVDKDGSTSIFSMDRQDVAIAFYNMPISIDTQRLAESGQLEEALTMLLNQVGSVNPRPDPTIAHPCMTADKREEGQGGQRWAVAADDLIIGITTVFPRDEQHLWRPIFERMLASFRVHRETEALLVRLAWYVVEKLHEALPGEKFSIQGMSIRSKDFEFGLANLLARVQNSPDDYRRLADEHVQGLLSALRQPELGNELWNDVQDKIVPMIKPDHFVQGVLQDYKRKAKERRAEVVELVASPWLADLVICYAIHDKPTFRLIHRVDLERWQMDLEVLHQRAVENLVASGLPELVCVDNPDGGPGFGIFRPADSVVSSYVLHPNLYSMLIPQLGPQLIAAIPSRDALIAFKDDPSLRQRIQETVRRDFESTENPLTDRLFRITPDGVTLA